MKYRFFCVFLSVLLIIALFSACRQNGGETEVSGESTTASNMAKSREKSGRGDGTFAFSEEADAALHNVRQGIFDEGSVVGIRYLGGVDKSGGAVAEDPQYLASLLLGTGLTNDWPFLTELTGAQLVETPLGQDLYVLIPVSDDCTLSVNKWICNEENGFVGEPGEVLYRSEIGTPILLICNYSDVLPDVNVTVVGNDAETSFEPMLSLRDGSITLPFNAPISDLTPYTSLDIDAAGPDNWLEELYNDELEIIAASVGTWQVPENERGNIPVYTVTDLDNNGRLELISTCSHGTGQYTTSHIYEITEDYNALTECVYEPATMSSEPELGVMSWAYYTDGGARAYIVNDFLREDYERSHNYQYAMWYADGRASVKLLAYVDMFVSTADGGEPELQYDYYDANDKKITPAEYDNIAETYFDAAAPSFIQLDWFDLDDDGPLTEKLQTALYTFCGTRANG